MYFSLSDWLAYGWESKTRITIIIGNETWDLFEFLTPADISAISRTWSKHLHAIACRVDTPAMHWSVVNHWVYCLPIGLLPSNGEHGECMLTSLSAAAASANDLVWHYAGLGYVVSKTVAQGDCGADTACQSEDPIPSRPSNYIFLYFYVSIILYFYVSIFPCFYTSYNS